MLERERLGSRHGDFVMTVWSQLSTRLGLAGAILGLSVIATLAADGQRKPASRVEVAFVLDTTDRWPI